MIKWIKQQVCTHNYEICSKDAICVGKTISPLFMQTKEYQEIQMCKSCGKQIKKKFIFYMGYKLYELK